MPNLEKKSIINDVTIEITNHCQLHCRHCGIWSEKERHDIKASCVIRMLRELLERYRIYFISLTGGEPFLHSQCGSLLRALSTFCEHGEISGFGVYTNAACTERIQKALSVLGDSMCGMEMGISIDGLKDTHDLLRGSGAYDRTMQTVKWIVENFRKSIEIELKFTINSLNYAQLIDVYRLARDLQVKFSPKLMESQVLNYYHRSFTNDTGQLAHLSPEMVEQVCRQIETILRDDYSGIDRVMVQAMRVVLLNGTAAIRGCMTPARALFITSRRDVYPCLYLPPVGNVGLDGTLPMALDTLRVQYADAALQGGCPKCVSYHGFMKLFNLEFLQAPPEQRHLLP